MATTDNPGFRVEGVTDRAATGAPARRPGRRVLTVIGLWFVGSSLLALVLTAQEGLSFLWSFQSSGLQCAILVLLLLPVAWFLPRFEQRGAFARGLLHVGLALILVPMWEFAFHFALSATASPDIADIRRETSGYWRWLQGAMMYGVVVGGMVMLRTNRRLRAEERRASELQLLMREAELRALRAQLRPHFLFNTLNSIYSLIEERPREAATMVAMLSDLMRETLELTDRDLVPLSSELRLVERYLAIEAVRLGERLSVAVQADDVVKSALVPPLLLQPLVENAVHHGIAPMLEPGEIRVEAESVAVPSWGNGAGKSRQRLRLVVRDNGSGWPDDSAPGSDNGAAGSQPAHGNGLRITQSRLKNQYQDAFKLTIDRADPTQQDGASSSAAGTVVLIEIPFEEALS